MLTLAPPAPRTTLDRLNRLKIGVLGDKQVDALKVEAEELFDRRYRVVRNAATALFAVLGIVIAVLCGTDQPLGAFWAGGIVGVWFVLLMVAVETWYNSLRAMPVAKWQTVTYRRHIKAWYRRPLPEPVTELADQLSWEFGANSVLVERTAGDPFLLVNDGDGFVYVAYWQGRDKLVLGV